MRPEEELNSRERYLLDPSAPPDESVAELERMLRPLRFDGSRHELELQARNREATRRWPRRVALSIAAAAALLLVMIGLRAWFWSWPDGRPWKTLSPGVAQQTLGEGERLQVGEDGATVRIARIGTMRVEPESDVQLLSTGGVRHRIAIDRGELSVGVWAPPFSVTIETPAGSVLDMGCAFDLAVDGEVTDVEVTSGWVQLQNRGGEVLVPEGAVSRMEKGSRASVPVFLDASREFQSAVRRMEEGNGSLRDVETIGRHARRRDVYTILLLSERSRFGRRELLEHAARLAPPPSPELFTGASTGSADALWSWAETLELPPPKSWVRNWRDAFGRP